jgi:hypothetical protein
MLLHLWIYKTFPEYSILVKGGNRMFLCISALDDKQEASLIEIMVCCVKQAATGESPVGRSNIKQKVGLVLGPCIYPLAYCEI